MSEIEYKTYYTGIFSLNYFVQGVNQSIFTVVVPIYILNLLGYIDASDIATLGTIVLIPFVLKLIFGLLSDKIGIRKLGRRKPWIIGAATLSGIMWLIIPIFLLSTPTAAMAIFSIIGFFVMFGSAMADTAMDGFILDICPKEKLGRTTGACWGVRSVGIIVGGFIILLLMSYIQIEIIFVFLGILTIAFGSLTLIIKHGESIKNREIFANLKVIFKKRENWKVFLFSMFMAIVDGVIFLFLALYILIRAGLVNPVGATIETLETELNLYEPQAFITLIVSLGVLAGAFVGGRIADKVSRRAAVFLSFVLTTGSLLLLLIPIPSPLVFILLIFAFITGSSSGWSNSSFSAVASEYAKQYPDATSTYFSITTSFINFGTLLGLQITGALFRSVSSITTDVYVIYTVVFIFMAFLSNIALVFFLFLDRNQYEYKLANKEILESK